ncbi:myrosinase 1-like [Zerene cesonia]|uniref:myrosinase 1-like n=1 Tax=Zerene cesonia TaxID=33412 RepID=UPI0018E4DC3E|nr:myrosinase 1-like [Zerene cesonia]
MRASNILVFVISALTLSSCSGRKFPPGFKFGAATAAYQVEGAWNVSDKSPSIWDTFTHDHPEQILDGSNGDVACDSYHLWEQDIQLAKDLGLHFYRFSLSWPRLLPNGFANHISEDGSRYYNNLIDGLIANGIEPMITLFHWDLPQNLQDLGGMTNPLIAEWFGAYSRVAYTLFGDRVKTWSTFNEPLAICDVAYEGGKLAPGIASPETGIYLCAKNLMIAHATSYRIYNEEFRAKYNGKVGIVNHHVWFTPYSSEYEELTHLTRDLGFLYSHPIYSETGGWPPSVEAFVASKSEKEGYSTSRLPKFTAEEIEFVKGTADYYGFNYYTSRLVREANNSTVFAWPSNGNAELNVELIPDPNWDAGLDWLVSYPPGIRAQLNLIREYYGNVEIIITENGFSTSTDELDDVTRTQYFRDHLEQVLLANTEDGVNVTGYTAWSLIDNYEWNSGYTSRFGIVRVDFTDPLRSRTPRASAEYYADVIRHHSL